MARAGIITPTPLATPEEVAAYRRKTPAALATERYKGKGPKYKKLNGRIFYDWRDVTEWVEAHTMTRTDDDRATTPPRLGADREPPPRCDAP